ncbi:MAG TPA: hypothetical protein PLQ04_04325, partial [Lachnospiraceae bacterium]|nr:hypothetical protein [Lachnospiraceae bacterium]
MTSSPIFDMGVMMPAAQPMMPAKSAATDAGSFEQAIEQVTKGYDQDQKTDYQADTTKASKDVTKDENISQNAVKEKQTETDTAEDNQNTVVEEAEKALTEEEITVVDEAKEQLLEDIAAILNMTPAQLQSTLDTMGLQLNDLLEQENVNLLVSNVLGNGDPMELVLNEELSQAVFD